MGNLISIRGHFFLVLISLNIGCDQEMPNPLHPDPKLSPVETLVAKDWQYRDLMVNGDTLNVIAFNLFIYIFSQWVWCRYCSIHK